MRDYIYLILENKTVFKGKSFGAKREAVGELVFNTAMTGYLETLTDPNNFGQIVVQTFPLIGNYGVIPSDAESIKIHLKAYIVKQWCQDPSNFRSEGNLDTFLKNNDIVGLYDIDTRELTKMIREKGSMNAKIAFSDKISDELINEIKSYKVYDSISEVSVKEPFESRAKDDKFNVALWDFGARENIKRELLKRGCSVLTIPYNSTAEDIKKLSPDGIVLSNGPGDPAENINVINEIKKISIESIPIFGICLGHGLLALSQGAKSEKLKYGHRGKNHPVINTKTGRIYITSQNHGYAVIGESLPDWAELSYKNVNDGTCEGVVYKNMPAISVQFNPGLSPGELDTGFLYDEFISLMQKRRRKHAAE